MRPEILNPLFAPVSSLEGVGPKLEKSLTRLLEGYEDGQPARIGRLLFHLPSGVIDRRRQPGIAHSPEGVIVTLKVRIDRHQPPPRGNRRVPYRVFVHDDTGEMALVFFKAHGEWLNKSLPVGEIRHVSGRMEWFNGRPSMVHPDHIVDEQAFADLPLVEPVYPLTAGISLKVMARSIRTALSHLPVLPEWNDPSLMKQQAWPDFRASLERVHNPRDMVDLDLLSPARKRLAHDELLAGQLALALVRERMRKTSGKARNPTGLLQAQVLKAFGHQPTPSQLNAIAEVLGDLKRPERMLRLLQGDVGSGKTLVALMAMAATVEDGAQAAIMAPTEILARQHFATIAPLCEAAGIRAAVLTGRDKGSQRREILEGLADGSVQILVGTHALFQGTVEFRDLGMVVIDEQHRFGVHQRLALSGKGPASDVLVMTATPIPRTLVLTYFGDMDVSKLTGKPAGRQPIRTTATPLDRLDDLIERTGKALLEGQKLYWICPLVEDSEELPVTSAEDRFRTLAERFGNAVGLVHGRMASAEKDAAMEAFRKGDTRLLVATTVIEVGVDVPDATIMVIEHAERFGLAQLHQLRGRVGRGDKPSSCILLYKAPLGEVARRRIEVMRETDDGFAIAEEDLKLRGEGEVLGTRQSGTPGFNLASAEAHADILDIARDEARMSIATDPDLETPLGEARRLLLYLFGQDQAIRLIRAG
ncbi:MAG: ATP-dependent DNA helicase RecG [Nitratireductor sp.]|nr:ATP-dependent DNA helicase RecG [Nitratireductor sp.]